jgi:hypothetical protein
MNVSVTARVICALGLASGLAVLVSSAADETPRDELHGRAPARATHLPGAQAAFEHESYRPGEQARLVVDHRSRDLLMQVFESGPERVPTSSSSLMSGVPVTRERSNFRADRDGRAGSWYVDKRVSSVRLGRAFLDRGVPYGLRNHLGFLTWLQRTGRNVDYLSQWDLEQVSSAAALEDAYDLIVFAGHHEYVTAEEYDLVEGYRDLGGNLVFLSANNFVWRVERKGDLLVKSSRWRHLDRPEAALVGVQYVGNQPSPRGAWVVRKTPARSWLFAGTDLRVGSGFGRGGVEIDQVTGASRRGVRVVAEIPHLFGPGMKAQMTYYETARGARVFAAGAFHLTRSVISDPVVWRMLENLWARMVKR